MSRVDRGTSPPRSNRHLLGSGFACRLGLTLRRSLFFLLVALSTLGAGHLMIDIVQANGISIIEAAILLLFIVNFFWIAMSFWTAAIGFALQIMRISRSPLGRCQLAEPPTDAPIETRTAIVMPIYKEDAKRVFAGLEAIFRSLRATGQLVHYDFFVLSDTTDLELYREEESAWRDLCVRTGAANQIFYRRRPQNHQRKSGNIAEFCRRWGGRYDFMVILDADSVMSGETIVKLTRTMQANPRAGIVQTFPVPVNRDSLFARIIQFANRLYGPILARGLAFWHQGDSNYWGHNAIIRTAAFTEHCGLPTLPGRAPLGGEILSHDFVEAALIRRAGWSVWLIPEVGGSYEEVPPNLIEFAQRDRRWCQGNLQHLKLLLARRFHPMSRVHLGMGVMAYCSSLLWLILLTLSTLDIVIQSLQDYSYFPVGYGLFPVWPVSKAAEALTLFGLTIGMLVLPKLFGLVATLADRDERRRFGGAGRMVASALLEQLYSMLQAPVMMLFHARFVIATLLGWSVGWHPQARDERGLSWREALRCHRGHMLLGAAWAAVILALAPHFFWWLFPVLAGLVVSVVLSFASSRVEVGRFARSLGLFLIPEERDPPLVLRKLASALRQRTIIPLPRSALAALERITPRPIRVQSVDLASTAAAANDDPPRVPEHRPRPMPPQDLEYPTLLGFRLSL